MRCDFIPFFSILMIFQDSLLLPIIDFLRDLGPWITVAGLLIGIVIAVRRNIIFKIKHTMGEEQLLDCIQIVADLMKDIPVQDIKRLLVQFKNKCQLEYGMKETLLDIHQLLSVKNAVNLPTVTEILQEYKRRKETATIKNKKRWDIVRKGKNMSENLKAVLEILNTQMVLQSQNTQYKARITAVNELIESIKAKIPENRILRKQLEEIKEKAEKERNIEKLDKTREKLYQIFTKMPSK